MTNVTISNNSRPPGRRYPPFSNANEIISSIIQKELEGLHKNNEINSQLIFEDDSEDSSSECSDYSNRFNSDAYCYVPEEYHYNGRSDDECANKHFFVDTENLNTNYNSDNEPSRLSEPFQQCSDRRTMKSDEPSETDSADNRNDTEDLKLFNEKKETENFPNISNTEPSKESHMILNDIISNLRKELSDIRINHQAEMNKVALKSSMNKRNYRLSFLDRDIGDSIKKQVDHDEQPNNIAEDFSELQMESTESQMAETFDNIIGPESINSTSKPENIQGVDKIPEIDSMEEKNLDHHSEFMDEKYEESDDCTHTSHSGTEACKDIKTTYIEKINKDFLKPLKETITDELSEIKKGLSTMYDNSPVMIKDIIDKSKSLLKQNEGPYVDIVNLDSYYEQTNSSRTSHDKETRFQKSDENELKSQESNGILKSYNIGEDNQDQRTIPYNIRCESNESFVIYKENKSNQEENKKVVKSLGDYSINFLNDILKVEEKFGLINKEEPNCKVRPWFQNPINEKMTGHSTSGSNNEIEDETIVLHKSRNIKYIIRRTNDGKTTYLVDNITPEDEEKAKEYNKKQNPPDNAEYQENNDLESPNYVEKKIYDPILEYKRFTKKKILRRTDWAVFGRAITKRNN